MVVSKLDRLARNTEEGLEVIQKLFDKGVAVHVLNVGLLENTSMGKFFITTLLAVAKMEKNTIRERMMAGKEIAKQDPNFKEGRPKIYKRKQVEHALELLESGNAYKEVTQMTGMSRSTLARAVKKKQLEEIQKYNEVEAEQQKNLKKILNNADEVIEEDKNGKIKVVKGKFI